MKKKPYSKQLALLLSTLSVIGTVHAESGTVEVDGSKEGAQIIVQRLVEQGVIVQLGQSNWYEINRARLQELPSERSGRDSRQETIRMLQELVGPKLKIEDVDIFRMTLSSQDVYGSGW